MPDKFPDPPLAHDALAHDARAYHTGPHYALAQRLERAEAAANAAFVDARARLDPSVGAEWINVAGAYAMFDGPESPPTQTFGIGMFDAFGAREFERTESFFAERGAPTFHEVCALAHPAVHELLHARNYAAIERSVVLTRTTHDQRVSSEISVRRIDAHEVPLWAETSGQGWSTEGIGLSDFLRQLGTIMAQAQGVHCFLAEIDGQPVAAGAINMQTDVALLAGASTIPSARGRGAQRALLESRLNFAAARGVDIAMIVTQIGSGSQRNAERAGFRVAYERTKWQLG